MKALSLIEPWASLIALGKKTIETRSWRPSERMIGERIAIHASKSREALNDGTAHNLFVLAGLKPRNAMTLKEWSLGCIICTAVIGPIERTEHVDGRWREVDMQELPLEWSFGNYTAGRWCFHLKDVLVLPMPLKHRGGLSFWQIDPAVEMAMTVKETYAPTPSASPPVKTIPWRTPVRDGIVDELSSSLHLDDEQEHVS